MNATIALILTTAVTISTIIYTFYSIQLWRTTRAATEISRQAALSNLWAELNRYMELLRREDAPEVAFLQKLSDLLLEFMLRNLFAYATSKDSQGAAELRRRISAITLGEHALRSNRARRPSGASSACAMRPKSLIAVPVPQT